MSAITVAKAPCKSCPYRRDVPSGVWSADAYSKLPEYDGGIGGQVSAGATRAFMCHQQDGKLCAGWVGCHGASELLALRLQAALVAPSVWTYKSPVPLFKSGAAAAAHGMRAIARPGVRARRTIQQLMRKREARRDA